jgi:hypothetical protein
MVNDPQTSLFVPEPQVVGEPKFPHPLVLAEENEHVELTVRGIGLHGESPNPLLKLQGCEIAMLDTVYNIVKNTIFFNNSIYKYLIYS